MVTKKITLNELRSLVKRIIKEEINKKKSIKEQWNPDSNYQGSYYLAIADMDEPGEAKAHVISQEEYGEYEENDWSITGPFTEEEASRELEKINQSNRDWRYYDRMDDNEGKSNLYIDRNDKFEADSLDKNW